MKLVLWYIAIAVAMSLASTYGNDTAIITVAFVTGFISGKRFQTEIAREQSRLH